MGTNLSPTTTWQTTAITSGKYYTFTVPAISLCNAPTYTFSLTSNGGSASFDSQITILDNSGTFANGYNDDFGSLQSQVTWTPTIAGTYRVLISTFSCDNSIVNTGTLAYSLVNSTGSISSGGALTSPTNAWQIKSVTAGNYYSFTVPAASSCPNIYYFSFCQGGGTAGFNTELRILNSSLAEIGAYNNDYCGQSSELTWAAPAAGTYYVLVTKYNCITDGTTATLAYKTTHISGSPYCNTDDAISISIPGYSYCAQFTADANNQRGCVWNTSTISFASAFDYTVKMYFGDDPNGADGCTFTFQNAATGLASCGTTGGQLGIGGVSNALVIEFDTYDNDSPMHVYDMTEDHIAIETDGNLQNGTPLSGPIQASATSANICDGALHDVRITWNPSTNILQVYFDGSLRLSCTNNFITNVFGGNPNVYWGFTGATGGLSNQQYYCPISIPLPVEMMDYFINCNENKVDVNWTTASEINSQYFTIERSSDMITFDKLITVNGAGNSNEIIKYSWTDNYPIKKTAYYRIRQTDFDGKETIFEAKETNCNNNSGKLNISYISSTNYGMFIDFNTSFEGEHVFTLTNILGEKIMSFSSNFNSGENQQTVILPNHLYGFYVLTICNSENKVVKKLLVK